jgi:flagellin-like protein
MHRADRAVSSVIGNILLVAVAVVLAAVLGTFALGMGEDISQTGPRATLEVSDASGDVDATTYQADEFVDIAHDGGDALQVSEITIKIRTASGNEPIAEWNGTAWEAPATNVEKVEFTTVDANSVFSVGDRMALDIKDNGGSLAGEYTVQIVHPASGSILHSETVAVR